MATMTLSPTDIHLGTDPRIRLAAWRASNAPTHKSRVFSTSPGCVGRLRRTWFLAGSLVPRFWLAAGLSSVACGCIGAQRTMGILLAKIVLAGIFVFFFFFRLILRMPRYRQAAFGWCITKATLAVRSFLFLLGSLVAFFQGRSDAIDLMLLGVIWFPGVEFASSLANRQRYITIVECC